MLNNELNRSEVLRERKIEVIEELIGNFTNTAGHCDVWTKGNDLYLTDGYNHAWYYQEIDFEKDIVEIIEDLQESIYNYDMDEELEIVIKNDIPNKPSISSIVEGWEDAKETLGELYNYLNGKRCEIKDKIEELRNEAIEWQLNFGDNNYSCGELANWGAYFETEAQKISFDLLEEFKENAIC